MTVIKAPNSIEPSNGKFTVFLAGSIEMGKAIDWQKEICDEFKNSDDVCILNPRRDDWDSSWEQSIDNPEFFEQVNWELDGLEGSDLILLYLSPETKSPISLLELGLMKDKNIVVCCPEGFWRKGNIDVVCQRYNIKQVNDIESLKNEIRNHIHKTVSSRLKYLKIYEK